MRGSRRFDPLPTPVAPAACPADPAAAHTTPAVPAVPSAGPSSSPEPAVRPAGRPPVRLSELGDVLTDADLAALLQKAVSWPRRERDRAKAAGVSPNLPARIDIPGQPRYRKVDVEHWLKTGSSTRVSLRRVG